MRKYKANPDEVLKLLKQGQSTTQVASQFNVQRQAIDEQRRRFIKKGLLPPTRARRGRKVKVTPQIAVATSVSLDQIDEWIINKIELAAKVPGLEEEIERLGNKLAASENEVVIYKDAYEKTKDKAMRLEVAQRQGTIYGD